MSKYILIGRESTTAIINAGKDLLILFEQPENLILIDNIITYMQKEVELGATFSIVAIEHDLELEIEDNAYHIQFDTTQQETISVFNFIYSQLKKMKKKLAENDKLKQSNDPVLFNSELFKMLATHEI